MGKHRAPGDFARKFSPAQRQWVYGVMIAGVPLAAVSSQYVAQNGGLILGLAAAVLAVGGGGLALGNMPKKDTESTTE